MVRIHGAVRIDAPVEEVFDLVADERNEPTYNPRIVRAEKVSVGPVGRGTTFVAEPKGAGRLGEMTVELLEYDRPHRLRTLRQVVVHGGRRRARLRAAAGGTRLRWDWDMRPGRTPAPPHPRAAPRRTSVGAAQLARPEAAPGAAPRLSRPGGATPSGGDRPGSRTGPISPSWRATRAASPIVANAASTLIASIETLFTSRNVASDWDSRSHSVIVALATPSTAHMIVRLPEEPLDPRVGPPARGPSGRSPRRAAPPSGGRSPARGGTARPRRRR